MTTEATESEQRADPRARSYELWHELEDAVEQRCAGERPPLWWPAVDVLFSAIHGCAVEDQSPDQIAPGLRELTHIMGPKFDSLREEIAQVALELAEAEGGDPAPGGGGAPDPTVELSDALTRPKEELTLLELAVMEAPNRGEEFADMLRWRLHDTRRKLEEAQERATELLQERRGELNGGGGRE